MKTKTKMKIKKKNKKQRRKRKRKQKPKTGLQFSSFSKGDMVKHELRVRSYELRFKSLKA